MKENTTNSVVNTMPSGDEAIYRLGDGQGRVSYTQDPDWMG